MLAAQQRHPLLATGDEQRLQGQFVTQPFAAGDQFLFAGALAGDRLELRQIGGDEGGAPVGGEVPPFGVHQHRLAGLARQGDELLGAAQCPLAVVGEDHRIGLGKQLFEALEQIGAVVAWKAVLEVEADELLMATQHPQLGHGGGAG